MDKPLRLRKFKGVTNTQDPLRVAPEYLVAAKNVDLDDTGKLRRRKGYQQIASGVCHSLWSNQLLTVFRRGDELLRLNEDDTTTVLRSGLSEGRQVSYVEWDKAVYYSDGEITGKIVSGEALPWGIPRPASNGDITASIGTLQPGTYQVALTYSTEAGEESGASLASQFTLTAVGGLNLENIPQSDHPGVSLINVYMSPPDGDTLYLTKQLPAGTSSALMPLGIYTLPLRTQFLSPPPAGEHLAVYNGCIYIASGKVLWATEAFAPGLCRRKSSFVQMEHDITMLAAATQGLWVGTSRRVVFLQGEGVWDFKEHVAASSGCFDGVYATASSDRFNLDGVSGDIVLWAGPSGYFAGTSDGRAIALTSKKFVFPEAVSGAMGVVDNNGISQVVSTVTPSSGPASTMYASDYAEAEIIRDPSRAP